MYFIKTSVTEPYVFHYINIYILLNGIKLRGQEQKNLKKKGLNIVPPDVI